MDLWVSHEISIQQLLEITKSRTRFRMYLYSSLVSTTCPLISSSLVSMQVTLKMQYLQEELSRQPIVSRHLVVYITLLAVCIFNWNVPLCTPISSHNVIVY